MYTPNGKVNKANKAIITKTFASFKLCPASIYAIKKAYNKI